MRGLLSFTVEALLGSLMALAPRRYWGPLDRRFHVRQYVVLSAILTALVGLVIGVPAFLRHTSAAASAASHLTIEAAAAQIQHPDGPEPTTLMTRVLSAMFVLSFVLTPVGFITTYLAVSGVFRNVCVGFDDPIGDPALTLLDAIVRRLRSSSHGLLRQLRHRHRFGPQVADQVLRGGAAGFSNADFVVIASRPKEAWTADVMIVADDGAYRVVDLVEQLTDRGFRVLYVLKRKTDSEIVRRTIRYPLPRTRPTALANLPD